PNATPSNAYILNEDRRAKLWRVIPVWGALISGVVGNLSGDWEVAAVFAASGAISALFICWLFIKNYRDQDLARFRGLGRRWGAIGGMVNTPLAGALSFFLFTSPWAEGPLFIMIVVLTFWGFLFGLLYGALIGLWLGALSGWFFEQGFRRFFH
ncbi:MAG TPA: hypothetical protein VIK48_06275, partial [Candidatus Manganitrophaceae bacterium]